MSFNFELSDARDECFASQMASERIDAMKDLFGEDIKNSQKRGGGNSVYHIIGASNHCAESRADEDFYATDPRATELLCDIEQFDMDILEPCCGKGHIAKVLKSHGYRVAARDLVDRGYGDEHGIDFLSDNRKWHGSLVTNPPYNMAQQFVEHALDIVDEGAKVAMFLKLTFAEGKARKILFKKNPPIRIWVSSSRLECGKNGEFGAGSAICYCWWIWEKGYNGNPEIRWFN